MNTLFAIVKNLEFVEGEKYKLFFESLKNLDTNDKVVILNTTSAVIKNSSSKCEILNITTMNSDLNIYGAMSGYLNQHKLDENDYIVVCDIENVVFTRNPFSFLKYFLDIQK